MFRHLHPTMSQDGTWSAALTLPEPGDYRVVAQFVARDEGGNGDKLMLGSTTTVPGAWTREPLPRTRDGEDGTIEVAARGTVAVGNEGRLELEVRDSSGGPVDLGSYLGSSAHVTGSRERTGAAVHMHPLGQPEVGREGTRLRFHTEFEEAGDYGSSCRCGWTASCTRSRSPSPPTPGHAKDERGDRVLELADAQAHLDPPGPGRGQHDLGTIGPDRE